MKPDLTKKIDYTYTPTPTNLMIALDVNCRSMLFTLCQLHSYYADEDGVFFRTNADLVAESRMSEKLVRATIDTLYINGIITVWSIGKGKGKECNKYKLNIDKFKEFEKYTIEELKNPELQIETVKGYNQKGYTPSYLLTVTEKVDEITNEAIIHKNRIGITQDLPNPSPTVPQSAYNINNIDNKEIIDNKDNIKNEENLNNKEIIDVENNIKNEEDIENEYYNTLKRLFKVYGSNYDLILRYLAKYDYDCFVFLVRIMKNEKDIEHEYLKYYKLIKQLKDEFGD